MFDWGIKEELPMNAELVRFFINRVDTLVAAYKSKPAVIAFVGLGPIAAHALLSRPDSLTSLSSAPIPMKPDGVDAAALFEKAQVRAMRNTIEDIEMPIVCLYEQLKPLAKSLSSTFEGTIILVFNNLFTSEGRFPTPVSMEDLEAFAAHFEDSGSAGSDLVCGKLYTSVDKIGERYLVCPLLDDDWGETGIELVQAEMYPPAPAQHVDRYHDGLEQISVPSPAFTRLKLRLSEFDVQEAEFVVDEEYVDGESCDDAEVSLVSVLLEVAGVSHEIGIRSAAQESVGNGERLLPLFHAYWGNDKNYRALKMYKDPDRSMKLEEVSQGHVADYVVTQAEAALNGLDDYTDIFVTAPTGAGKSLLFQLPALYLGEKYDAITLVIEPLKALMKDQADGLRKRGAKQVAVVNGDLTYSERTEEYERIKSGQANIVYLAPEMLLASDIKTIIGTRRLGLVVIDEAHTVATWGKDFRPDYWYLGSYLSKLRRFGTAFPIFCLTATAVYGGVDDVVMQTISELELMRCKKFLGNVRRDDITFCIQTCNKDDYPGVTDEVKTELAGSRIRKFVSFTSGQTLVYCPFRSHVEAIMSSLEDLGKSGKVLGYHGGRDTAYRNEAQKQFTDGTCRAMVCTKAFGMGIDVDDIVRVYHYAPTGNISDYIQEIGRAARREGLQAKAVIDFFKTDANYYRQLYSMSGFSQGQLREVLRKLYSLYWTRPKRTQNMLVSPESFTYLFPDEKDLDTSVNKARSALLMVAKDLQARCSYPVMVIAPRTSNTKNYVCVADETKSVLEKRWGTSYLKPLRQQDKRIVYTPAEGSKNSSVTARDIGSIYELDSARLWEDHFADYSFADFKRRLFEGEILGKPDGLEPISPRTRLRIAFADSYASVVTKFDAFTDALECTFRRLSHHGEFTAKDFKDEMQKELSARSLETKVTDALLKFFVAPYQGSGSPKPQSAIKCVDKVTRKGESRFKVVPANVQKIATETRRTISRCEPNEGNEYVVYLNRDCYASIFEMAELLEIIGLAIYENRGGSGADLFIRLNSPSKINAFARDRRYSNAVLRELNERHRHSSELITRFFSTEMKSDERWDLVEHYFLGHDDYVDEKLGAEPLSGNAARPKAHSRKQTATQSMRPAGSLSATITSTQTTADSRAKVRSQAIRDCDNEAEAKQLDEIFSRIGEMGLEWPVQGAMLQIESTGERFCAELAWPRSKALLFLSDGIGAYASAFQTNWLCCMLGTSFDFDTFMGLIKKEKADVNETAVQ